MVAWNTRVPGLETWSRLIIVATTLCICWASSGHRALDPSILFHPLRVQTRQSARQVGASIACVGPQNMQALEGPRGVDLEVLGHRDGRCPSVGQG